MKRSAWRGPKGNAPNLFRENDGGGPEKRVLPKYLRGVSSKIATDLSSLRRFRRRAEETRMSAARETVAKRRMDRYEVTGETRTGGEGDVFDDAGIMAREIAGKYAEVVEGIVSGSGGIENLTQYFGDVVDSGGEEERKNRKEEEERDARMKEEAATNAKETYTTRAWVGEFDFSKGGNGKGNKKGGAGAGAGAGVGERHVSEEEAFKLESGEDVRIMDAVLKERR